MPSIEIPQQLPSRPMPPPSVVEQPDGYSDDDSSDNLSNDDWSGGDWSDNYGPDISDDGPEPLFEELD